MPSNPLTRAERERMRELESKASDAPWARYARRRMYKVGDKNGRVVTTKSWTRIGEDHEFTIADADNLDFIAAARTFIPRALDALDEADAERERLDLIIAEQSGEIASLNHRLGKLLGAVKAYMQADPQVRGELFRDLGATVRHIDDPAFDDYGWPRVVKRLEDLLVAARADIDARDALLREVLRFGLATPHDPAMDPESADLCNRIRAMVEGGE